MREHNIRWKKANAEKVKEGNASWREQNLEKVREQNKEWKKANPEKVEASRRRWQERKKAQFQWVENERQQRLREIRKKANERQQRYRKANPESREDVRERARRYYHRNKERIHERKRAYRRKNKEKCALRKKEYRERNREALNEKSRQYHQAHKEQRNEARRRLYAKQKGRPVLPPPPPCDCGLCLACGGWAVTWKPDWHARLKAWSTPGLDSAKEDQPLGELEDLPLDLLESEAETLSTASTSEIDSELGDRLETLLADESDSEVETGPATAPTRRSSRIATMPTVSHLEWEEENPMLEILRRKVKLHSEATDRIVTRWELLDRRTDRVDAIVEEMSVCVDRHHELDRFQAQLERQDVVMDVVMNEELFDFIGGQL